VMSKVKGKLGGKPYGGNGTAVQGHVCPRPVTTDISAFDVHDGRERLHLEMLLEVGADYRGLGGLRVVVRMSKCRQPVSGPEGRLEVEAGRRHAGKAG
jgi:hypothetical protein